MRRTTVVKNPLTRSSESGAYEPDSLSIDPVKMLRIHGYKDMNAVRPIIRRTAEEIAVRAAKIMTPVAMFRRVGVIHCNSEGLTLENGVSFEGHAFSNYFAGAKEVVVVIITVGKELDDEVIGCMDVFEPLEALFLETAGWLGIESTTRSFKKYLNEHVSIEKLKSTRRMGPGYSYKVNGGEEMWSLEDQRDLFSVFDNADLPVRLLESCAMMPKMSRSGVYGLVPTGNDCN